MANNKQSQRTFVSQRARRYPRNDQALNIRLNTVARIQVVGEMLIINTFLGNTNKRTPLFTYQTSIFNSRFIVYKPWLILWGLLNG